MGLEKDKERLRELAKEWAALAELPVMEERKRLWADLHGLKKTRPMILIETAYIDEYIRQDELVCENAYLRNVEEYMLENIVHAKEAGDDIVLEKYFRIGWSMQQPSFGIDVHMIDTKEHSKGAGYVFEHTVREPGDLKKLVKREFLADKDLTRRRKEYLEEIFGDILPVRVGNYGFMDSMDGNFTWVGNFFFGLTWQLHRFVGLDQMLYWYYDHPDEMHQLMQYMADDRLRMFKTLEKEGCLVSNSDNQMAGPRFYGYCSDLPYFEGEAALSQLWAWCESQESSSISPDMYGEFVLPYLAKLAKEFAFIYYGCCEPVGKLFERITRAIPNVRAFSVSMWNDFDTIGEMIGKNYVFSNKPAPPPLSGKNADWIAVKKDLERTKKAARGSCLELLLRDIYDINGDRSRLKKWTDTVKSVFEL